MMTLNATYAVDSVLIYSVITPNDAQKFPSFLKSYPAYPTKLLAMNNDPVPFFCAWLGSYYLEGKEGLGIRWPYRAAYYTSLMVIMMG